MISKDDDEYTHVIIYFLCKEYTVYIFRLLDVIRIVLFLDWICSSSIVMICYIVRAMLCNVIKTRLDSTVISIVYI